MSCMRSSEIGDSFLSSYIVRRLAIISRYSADIVTLVLLTDSETEIEGIINMAVR